MYPLKRKPRSIMDDCCQGNEGNNNSKSTQLSSQFTKIGLQSEMHHDISHHTLVSSTTEETKHLNTTTVTGHFQNEQESSKDTSEPFVPNEQDKEVDEALTFTCRGQCGEQFSYPCSCSEVCVVYKTCCENMTQDCPHIIEKGRKTFASVLDSDIVCEREIYKIVSCPPRRSTLHTDTEVARETSTIQVISVNHDSDRICSKANQTSTCISDPLSDEAIKRRILNAPVTDVKTGVTYINKSIWDCNVDSDRKFWSWGLNFAYNPEDQKETFLKGSGVMPILSPYKPLFDTNILISHLCASNIINTCDGAPNLNSIQNDDRKRCGKFTGIVVSGSAYVLYGNRYCAYCHEGRQSKMVLTKQNFPPSFRGSVLSIIVSLTASENFLIEIDKPSHEREYTTWSSAECPSLDHYEMNVVHDIDQNFLNLNDKKYQGGVPQNFDDSPCDFICYKSRYIVSSDGLCKAKHTARVAFGDDGLQPLCRPSLVKISQFVSCGVHHLLKQFNPFMLHAEFVDPILNVATDLRTNKKLYIITLNMNIPAYLRMYFSDSSHDLVKNIIPVALSLKAVREFRVSYDVSTLCEESVPTRLLSRWGEEEIVESGRLDKLYFSKNHFVNVTAAMSESRGPVKHSDNATTFCVSSTLPHPASHHNILCMEDLDYEEDGTVVKQLLSSHCGTFLYKSQDEQNIRGLGNRPNAVQFGAIHALMVTLIMLLLT